MHSLCWYIMLPNNRKLSAKMAEKSNLEIKKVLTSKGGSITMRDAKIASTETTNIDTQVVVKPVINLSQPTSERRRIDRNENSDSESDSESAIQIIEENSRLDQKDNPINVTVNVTTGNTSKSASEQARQQNIPCGCKIDRKKPCDDFREKLKQLYGDFILPKIAWLDEADDLPIAECFTQLNLTQSNKEINIQEIFKDVNNKKPSRILIEGQPGYGKTTLAHKIVYDWVKEEEYINHFKLVFLLPLRAVRGCSFEEFVTSIGQQCKLEDKNDTFEIVKTHEKEILFVLDGLDEVSNDKRSILIDLLYEQRYTIIVLNRSGLFNLSKNEKKNALCNLAKKSDFHDKHISILGFQSISSKIQFLKNIFKERMSDQQIYDIIDQLKLQLGLFDSPLFLMMLTVIINVNGKVQTFTTKTELYKELFNFIIKHSYAKSGQIGDDDVDFDLFNISSLSSPIATNIQKNVKQFGEFCISKIIKSDLQFECTDLTKQIYQAGLLIHHKNMTDRGPKYYYEAFHLSFLEFAAAYALWIQIKFNHSNVKELLKKLLKQCVMHFYETHGTSLVLVFLASLMGNDLEIFLSQIKLYSAIFSSNFSLTVKLLSDCASVNIMQDFLPSSINLRYGRCINSPVIIKSLLMNGTQCGKVNRILINFGIELQQIPNIIIPNAKIILIPETNWISNVQLKVNCNPKTVMAHVNRLNLSREFGSNFRNWLNFLTSPNIASCSIDWTRIGYIDNEIQIILEKQFNNIKYNYLHIISKTDCERKIVTQLVQNNQVEFVRILNFPGNIINLTNFYHAAVQSTNLNYIDLSHICFDLYELTAGGTKKYKYMRFDKCVISCSQPLKQRDCCEYLMISNMQDFENIEYIEPKSLNCRCDLLEYLTSRVPKWHGFINLEHLELDPKLNLNFKVIASLNNLHSLLLHKIDPCFNECTIDCILKLPIVKFGIYQPYDRSYKGYTLLDYFIKRVNNALAERTNVHLKTIHYFLSNDKPLFNQALSQSLEVIKCNNFEKVIIVYGHIPDLFVKRYINFDDFNLVHYMYGSHDDDFDYYKNLYSKHNYNQYEALCITKK